ncbi:MAG: hypothetical protein P8J93_03800 [SAR86 cluster bacterium]|nr:hypothetical protein [SAR86 cluster bacterium]
MDAVFYSIVVGLGSLWLGFQIIWIAGLPKQLQSIKDSRVYSEGSKEAFMAFWFNQYAWIGFILILLGLISITVGAIL